MSNERGLIPYSDKEAMALAIKDVSDELLQVGHDNVEEFLALIKQEIWDREHTMVVAFNEEFKEKWAHVFDLFNEGWSILRELYEICENNDGDNNFISDKHECEDEKAWVVRYESFLARVKDMPSRGHTPLGGPYGTLVFREEYRKEVDLEDYMATTYSSEVLRRIERKAEKEIKFGLSRAVSRALANTERFDAEEDYYENWSRYRYVRDTKIEAFDKVVYFLRNVMIKSERNDIRPAQNDDWKTHELKHYCLKTHKLEKPKEWKMIEDEQIVDAIYGRGKSGNKYATCFDCNQDGQNRLAVRTYYERGWQEMPGAPVHPTYEYYTCMRCGEERKGTEHGDFPVGGVDLIGQPLFAGMSTEEVCRQCSCYTTAQYGGSGMKGSDRECWSCYGEPGHY